MSANTAVIIYLIIWAAANIYLIVCAFRGHMNKKSAGKGHSLFVRLVTFILIVAVASSSIFFYCYYLKEKMEELGTGNEAQAIIRHVTDLGIKHGYNQGYEDGLRGKFRRY